MINYVDNTPSSGVFLIDDGDSSRTLSVVGPRNSVAQLAAIATFFGASSYIYPIDNSPDSLRAAIPIAATSAPPAIMDNSVQGSVMRYAMENHTHAGKIRKEVKTPSGLGVYTWTFPTAFGAGVVPICNAIALCPTGTTSLVNVQQEGDATNTQVSYRVTVYSQSAVSLLGLTILSLASSLPTGVKLSMEAFEP